MVQLEVYGNEKPGVAMAAPYSHPLICPSPLITHL